MKPIQIDVPATSANLGPGFDSLALALDLTDTLTVEFDDTNQDAILCEGQNELDPRKNLTCRAYRAWGRETAEELPGARFRLESRIPIGKGLGSSAAAIVGGLAAASHAAGHKDPQELMLRLAAGLEGHPDNTTAAILGGVTTAYSEGDTVHALHVANHLSLGVALFIPDTTLSTTKTRAALPSEVSLSDAVYNLSRVSYLVTALIWGRWDRIGPAMHDRLHLPYRSQFLPGFDAVLAAAVEAGAYGATLSGGGPAVIALGPRDRAEHVAAAMNDTAAQHEWPGESMVTRIQHLGVRVKEIDPA